MKNNPHLDFFAVTCTFGGAYHQRPADNLEAAAWVSLAFLLAAYRTGGSELDRAIEASGSMERVDTVEVRWTHGQNTYPDLWVASKDRAATIAGTAIHQSLNASALAHDLFQAVFRAAEEVKWDGSKPLIQNRFTLMRKFLHGAGGEYRASDKALVGARIELPDFQTFVQQFPGHEWLMASLLWQTALKQLQPAPRRKWSLFG